MTIAKDGTLILSSKSRAVEDSDPHQRVDPNKIVVQA
jgi:hypothetical protein